MAKPVCERYAAALFEATVESDCLETVLEQTTELCSLFGSLPDYIKLLSSPVVEAGTKQAVLKEAFSEVLHPYLFNFLMLLSENGRFSDFFGIAEEFRELYDKHKGILRVTATTAVELTPELSKRLQDKLSAAMGKTIMLQNKVDPTILGGVLLRYGNTELDGSVAARLSGMRQHIKDSAVSADKVLT